MRRPIVIPAALAFSLALAACRSSSTTEPPPSGTSVSSSPSATITASASPSVPASPTESPSPPTSPTPSTSPPPAEIELPEDAPVEYRKALEHDTVPLAKLLPPGAQPAGTWITGPPNDPIAVIAVVWSRGDDPFLQERGFEVWQRFTGGAPWRVVYAFTDAEDSGVLGIRIQVGDATGDGQNDVLTAEDTGGSGACATWRIVGVTQSAATELYRKDRCDTDMVIGEGKLVVTSSVFRPGDSHCCPSATRLTTLSWNGRRWNVVDKQLEENG